MRRRSILALILLPLLLIGGIVPWSVTSGRLTERIADQLASGFGVRLAVTGRTSIAFLPVPRVKLNRVTVTTEDGTPLVRDAQLKGELRVLSLLTGGIELNEVSVSGGQIAVALDGAGRSAWSDALARAARAARSGQDGAGRLRRIIVAGADVELSDARNGARTGLKSLNLLVNWATPDSPLDLTASAGWRGETVSATLSVARPAELIRSGRERLEGQISNRLGNASLSGELALGESPAFTGRMAAASPSAGSLLRWLGVAAPRPLDRPLDLSGDGRIDHREIAWSRLRLGVGDDRLDGALAMGFGPDLSVRATLATGQADLGWLQAAIQPSVQIWAEQGSLAELIAGARLDVRLSGSDLRLGAMRFGDSAASLLVDEGRIDLALLRATLDGGTLKGRLSAVTEAGRADIKGHLSFDKVDAASLARTLGQAPMIAGTMRGQASFETAGDPEASLGRRLAGRASITVRNGEILRLDGGGTKRGDGAASPEWPAGRAAFDEAQVTLTMADGVAEITEGRMGGATIRASMQGRVSIPDRSMTLRAVAAKPAPALDKASLVLDLSGPWGAPILLTSVER